MTFDPGCTDADQYKPELAMSRLVSKYVHSRVGYCYDKFHSPFHNSSPFSSQA